MTARGGFETLIIRHSVEAAYRLVERLEDRTVETESRADSGVSTKQPQSGHQLGEPPYL
jgi:hypothetical protein